jgi:hypothetical protein
VSARSRVMLAAAKMAAFKPRTQNSFMNRGECGVGVSLLALVFLGVKKKTK